MLTPLKYIILVLFQFCFSSAIPDTVPVSICCNKCLLSYPPYVIFSSQLKLFGIFNFVPIREFFQCFQRLIANKHSLVRLIEALIRHLIPLINYSHRNCNNNLNIFLTLFSFRQSQMKIFDNIFLPFLRLWKYLYFQTGCIGKILSNYINFKITIVIKSQMNELIN